MAQTHLVFQSTHPCGVRTVLIIGCEAIQQFQSTHPCGVRTWLRKYFKLFSCFNPRTRVGCESKQFSLFVSRVVSIHAPVWGAKRFVIVCYDDIKFQSTHPCGVRTKDLKTSNVAKCVSIHAPVWGAKQLTGKEQQIDPVSIHAPVWGANRHVLDLSSLKQVSIHAPVWGANRWRVKNV